MNQTKALCESSDTEVSAKIEGGQSALTAEDEKLIASTPADLAISTVALSPEPLVESASKAEIDDTSSDEDPVSASRKFQSVALGVLAAVALIWFLKYAEDVMVPILMGLIISYSLRPFVEWLQQTLYIPRALSAALLLTLLFGGVGAGLWNLRADITAVAADLPKAARMLTEFVGTAQVGGPGLMSDIRRAANELDKASAKLGIDQPDDRKAARGGAAPVAATTVRPPSITEKIQVFLAERVGKALGVATTLGVAGLLAFLLLCAGTEYRKKLLQLVGQSLARKKITLTILNEINAQVQYYLAATAVTNLILALATWALLSYFGIERALLWGIIAGLLHLIPYIGTGLFLGICFLIGLVSLESFWPAFYLTIIWLLIEFIVGFGLTTYIQSRSSRINSAALFIGFLLFGWLWGGWGLIVAAPVLAALKAVADRVASLKEVSTLLS